ncbi:MAG: hypothetical protein EBS07_02465 [Sphingobacteriia bacterium]|nr:hypothetical protein [Sphingobacteriia bacterium]
MLTIYKASAGSGKTYTLTREYLRLALSPTYPTAYRHILAVTFTNKATAEMKQRILSELDKLSKGEPSVLSAELQSSLKLSPEELQHRASFVYHRLLHDFSSFAVTTIDSFFQQIIRHFTREAGLQGGYRLELDIEPILQKVTDQVMNLLGKPGQEPLLKWMVEMATEKVEKGDKWDFRKSLTDIGKELFREKLMRQSDALSHLNVSKEAFHTQYQQLYAYKNKVENHLTAEANAALDILSQHAFSDEDFFQKGRGLWGYLNKLSTQNYSDFNSYVAKGYHTPEEWIKKNHPQATSILTCLKKAKIKELLDFWENNKEVYKGIMEVIPHLNILGLTGIIREELQNHRQAENLVLLSDTNLLLNHIVKENDTPFIYEKTGNRFYHFLIDEFQDTSQTQWDNFRPLLINSLGQGYKNLVVGDIKQAIYRWRDGDWRLLGGGMQKSLSPHKLEEKPLQINWRSYPEIIEFNNHFFPQAVTYATNYLAADIENPAAIALAQEELKSLYSDVHQSPPANKVFPSSGFVNIRFYDQGTSKDTAIEGEENLSWEEECFEQLLQDIERLLNKGFSPRDLAILIRKKDTGRKVLSFLQDHKIPVSSQEAQPLGEGLTVRIIIAALHHLTDPQETLWITQCARDYLQTDTQSAVKLPWLPEEIQQHPIWKGLKEDRDQLLTFPLYDLVEELIRRFGLLSSPWTSETALLHGFLDALLEFQRYEVSDPISFLTWWDEEGHKKSALLPEGLDTIRILTIHKSKGLEFPVVLLPAFDWDIKPKPSMAPFLWSAPTQDQKIPFPLVPVKFKKALNETGFKGQWREELQLLYADVLNLLYVAFTRPRQALYVYTKTAKPQKSDGSEPAPHMGALLKYGIEQIALPHTWADAHQQWTLGAESKLTPEPKSETPPPSLPQQSLSSPWISTAWKDKLRLENRKVRSLTLKPQEAQVLGIWVHEILAQINHARELPIVLETMITQGRITQAQAQELSSRITPVFSHPVSGDWFQLDLQTPDAPIIRKEAAILTAKGEVRIPDRVMQFPDKTIVMDFKSGLPRPEHSQQLLEYAALLQDLIPQPVEAWLVYVNTQEPKVVQVPLSSLSLF